MGEVSAPSTKRLYSGILMLGVVSLVGDIIYEGARGITPSYLEFLGASAFMVGAVFGFSELLGYVLRLVGGVLADSTGAYWLLYALGYLLIVAVPMLALAGSWQVAAALILIERVAKALRSPARDTILSLVGRGVGAGKAFGLHELLDQLGAILGPALVAGVLYFTLNSYFHAFLSLIVPYAVLVALVVLVKVSIGPLPVASRRSFRLVASLPRSFGYYVLAVAVNTAGLIHVSLILFRASEYFDVWMVSLIYLAAQAVDAVAAPISGVLYDRYGRGVLLAPFAASVIPSILTVVGGWEAVVTAALSFGVIYGMQESIYRAAVSEFAPLEVRGTAYGIFNALYGLGLMVSGGVYGALLEGGMLVQAVAFAVLTEAAAIALLFKSMGVRA